MTDLRTRYLGLDLRSPIVASASPLTGEVDTAKRLQDAGVAAIVMPSLFEEEIVHEEVGLTRALEAGAEHFAEALDYFPASVGYSSLVERYVSKVSALKQAVDVPVIASLNATSTGTWVRYASDLQDAGADAIELNLYRIVSDPAVTAAEAEASDLAIIGDVRRAITVPLAVKLSPYYTSMAGFAVRAAEAGAGGLVLFNRFYQPDIDLDTLEVVPRLVLSEPWEMRLPLRWIAMIRPVVGPDVSLAHTTGISSGADVAKTLLAGADVAMMTSALLRAGPSHVGTVEAELTAWLAGHEYESVAQMRGSVGYATSDDPAAFERSNYVRTLHSWTAPPNLTPSSPSS